MRWWLAIVVVAGCTQRIPFSIGRTSEACPANPPGTTDGNVNHDDCLTDSDCGATGACLCQDPRTVAPFAPILRNACVGGNCRTDGDCRDGAGCELVNSSSGPATTARHPATSVRRLRAERLGRLPRLPVGPVAGSPRLHSFEL